MSGASGREAGFDATRECFEQAVTWLRGSDAAALTHGELEDHLAAMGRELLRRMLQDHLSLRALRETRLDAVVDAEQVAHQAVEGATVAGW